MDFTDINCALPVRSAAVDALHSLVLRVDVGDYAGKVRASATGLYRGGVDTEG